MILYELKKKKKKKTHFESQEPCSPIGWHFLEFLIEASRVQIPPPYLSMYKKLIKKKNPLRDVIN